MSIEGTSGYHPNQLHPDLTIDGNPIDDLIEAGLKQDQKARLRAAADGSFTKKMTSKVANNMGTGVGSALGVLVWTGVGAVAGATSTAILEYTGPHIQPYIENAGGYLIWGYRKHYLNLVLL